jgi:hypothetical protein
MRLDVDRDCYVEKLILNDDIEYYEKYLKSESIVEYFDYLFVLYPLFFSNFVNIY